MRKLIKLFVGMLFMLIVWSVHSTDVAASEGELDAYEAIGEIVEQYITDTDSVEGYCDVYNYSGELIGTSANIISQEGLDKGYVVYNIENNNVIEYAVEEGTVSIYEKIVSRIPEGYYIYDENVIFTENNYQYAVKISDGGNVYYLTDIGELKECYDLSITSNVQWSDVIIEIPDYSGDARYELIESYTLYGAVYWSEPFIEGITNRYACAVVAMLNLCARNGYFQYLNSNGSFNYTNIRHAFNMLWSLSNTTVYETDGGIEYGSTERTMIDDALEAYASDATNRIVEFVQKSSPTWSELKVIVDQGKYSVYSIKLIGEEDGHAVNMTGYAIYRDSITGEYIRYLRIADGWTETAKFLVYDSDYFQSMQVVY
jgi:hypothetical protein